MIAIFTDPYESIVLILCKTSNFTSDRKFTSTKLQLFNNDFKWPSSTEDNCDRWKKREHYWFELCIKSSLIYWNQNEGTERKESKTIPSVVNMKKLLENHGVSVNHWDIEAIVSLKWYESHPEETCHFNFCAILQKKWDMKFKEFG